MYFLTTLPHTFISFFLLTLLHPGAIIHKFAVELGGDTSSGRLQPSVQHIMHKQSSGCQILHRFRPQVLPSKTSLCPGKSGSWLAVVTFIIAQASFILSCYPKKRHSLDGLSQWMTSAGGKMNGKTLCSSIILNNKSHEPGNFL